MTITGWNRDYSSATSKARLNLQNHGLADNRCIMTG
jgi:hypothetical protein